MPGEHNEPLDLRLPVDLGLHYSVPFCNICVWGSIIQTLRSLLVKSSVNLVLSLQAQGVMSVDPLVSIRSTCWCFGNKAVGLQVESYVWETYYLLKQPRCRVHSWPGVVRLLTLLGVHGARRVDRNVLCEDRSEASYTGYWLGPACQELCEQKFHCVPRIAGQQTSLGWGLAASSFNRARSESVQALATELTLTYTVYKSN